MQCCDSHKTDLSFKDSYKQGFKVSPESLAICTFRPSALAFHYLSSSRK